MVTGIDCTNVESPGELNRLAAIASRLGIRAPVAIRVNPDVDPKTHPYIATGLHENKFGVSMDQAASVYAAASQLESIEPIGIACHIGSQLTELAPYQDAVSRVLDLVERLVADGITIQHIDVGGGLGIRYQNEQPPDPADFVRAMCKLIDDRYEIFVEPGRSIVGPAGVLLTQVQYLKQTPAREFAVVDAAMNDLLRPALYDAWHDIKPLTKRSDQDTACFDVVGPVCETGDFIARGRDLAVVEGDFLAVMDTGAYGFVMASAYNSRPRAPEVLVDGDAFYVVRERESVSDLMRGEQTLYEAGKH